MNLFDKNDNKLAVLDNILTASIKRIINSEFTLTLEAFEKELKSEFFDVENYIEADSHFFDIVYIQNVHENNISYSIECEHVSYRLINKTYVGGYATTGTPEEILSDLLSDTDLIVGEVTNGNSMTISVSEDTNAYQVMILLANNLGWELDYRGFEIDLKDEIGSNNGYEVRFGKNLKAITKHIDRRDGLKTYYEIDVLELKESEEYKKLGYEALEVINLGDTIKIYDEVINLNVEQKIVSIEYNPLKRMNTSLEITNKIELLSDSLVSIQNDIRENKALIDVTNGQITLLTEDVEGNTSSIQQNANNITSMVQDISGNTSAISQNADNITLKVSKDGVISSINQTAEQITISADKVDIEGVVSLANLVVGENVSMGSNATITWQQVTNQPEIIDENTVTTITQNEISTANISANQITTGTLSANRVSGGTLQGADIICDYFRTSAGDNRVEIRQYSNKIDFYVNDSVSSTIYDNQGDLTIWCQNDDVNVFGDDINIDAADDIRLSGNDLYWNNDRVATEDWVEQNCVTTNGAGDGVGSVNIIHSSFGVTIQSSYGSITLPWD